jgi:hypothetical protein
LYPNIPLIVVLKSETETPFNILNIRRICELNRTSQIQDPKVVFKKIYKVAEINMALYITFENYNTEFQEVVI